MEVRSDAYRQTAGSEYGPQVLYAVCAEEVRKTPASPHMATCKYKRHGSETKAHL